MNINSLDHLLDSLIYVKSLELPLVYCKFSIIITKYSLLLQNNALLTKLDYQ